MLRKGRERGNSAHSEAEKFDFPTFLPARARGSMFASWLMDFVTVGKNFARVEN